MNSYSKKIADELRALKNQGAKIPENIIGLAQNGRTDLGSMAVDNLKGKFDVSKLSYLSNLASREDYPEYWAKVDAAGGWQEGKGRKAFSKNVDILASLFS